MIARKLSLWCLLACASWLFSVVPLSAQVVDTAVVSLVSFFTM